MSEDTPSDAPPQVRRLVIEGHVQGVGFRWFARERARRWGLHGSVRNRDDGTVEVLVGGPEAAVERYVADLAVGPKGAQVSVVRAEGAGHIDTLPFPFTIYR